MDGVVKSLKWMIPEQIIGMICIWVGYWIPGPYDDVWKSGLLVFGSVLVVACCVTMFSRVYKPLKQLAGKKEQ